MTTIRATTIQIKAWFCRAVLKWRATGLEGLRMETCWTDVGDDVGIHLCTLCEHLATCRDPLPEGLRKALDLAPGATFADAVPLVDAALREPIEMTEEELTEEEQTMLLFSGVFEQLNAENPDLLPLPVLYPARMRRRQ